MMILMIHKYVTLFTFVVTIIITMHRTECSAAVRSSVVIKANKAIAHSTTVGDSSLKSSKEIRSSMFLPKDDDFQKILVGLRTFLMGVRNFAEAIGGFVPNDQHLANQKNTMMTKYNGLFNTIRIISNAAQFVTRFLEDILIKEINNNGESKQISEKLKFSSIITTMRSAVKTVRGIAAQAISAYSYYAPEISYTRCVGGFIRKEYPDVLREINLQNAVRALNMSYRYAADYISNLVSDQNQTDTTSPEQFQEQTLDYRQQLYSLYNTNSLDGAISNDLVPRTSRHATSIPISYHIGPRMFRKRSARQIEESVETEMTEMESNSSPANSIFNFDDAIKESLGMVDMEIRNRMDPERPSFQRCTQNYALQLLWRIAESFIMAQDYR